MIKFAKIALLVLLCATTAAGFLWLPPAAGPFRNQDLARIVVFHVPCAIVASVASAAKIGELFQYRVDNAISLPRQKSAMIPIITDPVEVEKLSIYNQNVLPKNPLNGARLKNITKKHLLQI